MLDSAQSMLLTIASFVAVLSLVVFVHEYGHFRAARWLRVAVDTFSIGFGKTLFGWRDRAGIQWKVGALPLGGYVKFLDDADGASTGPRERIVDPVELAAARKKGLFHAQPLLTRAIVVAAGPISNFIFSILAFALVIMVVGRDVTDTHHLAARIDGVVAGSPAATGGLQGGDVIIAINGQTVDSFATFQEFVRTSPGQDLAMQVRRGESIVDLTVTPRELTLAGGEKVGQVGVERSTLASERVIERVAPLDAVQQGAAQTWMIVAMTGAYLGDVITGKESGNQIAGPLGILQASGQVAQAAVDDVDDTLTDKLAQLALSLLQFAAVLSVAVGIVNLAPIPILDGGHLLFYGIEALRGGKPLPPVAQEWAYRAGFAVMACLFLFATWNDVSRNLAHVIGSG